jgi:hypothetical protein
MLISIDFFISNKISVRKTMIIPAWAHRERVRKELKMKSAKSTAQKAQKLEIKKIAENKKNHELLLVNLKADCKRLNKLPQGAAREQLKRKLIKFYLPLVNDYINSKQEFHNYILTQVMAWLFDLRELDEALELARIAIDQNQPMPKRYRQTAQTFVANAVFAWAKAQKNNGKPIEPYFSKMFDQVIHWQNNDNTKIKYLKLAAAEARSKGDIEKALEFCIQAEKIDPKKAKIKTFKAELQKAAAVIQ